MKKINLTDSLTGKTTTLLVNEKMERGDHFRLIGRDIEFVAFRVWDTPMGLTVYGASVCRRHCTTARVEDTAAIPEDEPAKFVGMITDGGEKLALYHGVSL